MAKDNDIWREKQKPNQKKHCTATARAKTGHSHHLLDTEQRLNMRWHESLSRSAHLHHE